MARSPVKPRTPRAARTPAPSASFDRREREKAETRARILVAARELFVQDGFERTTMRAIADRIGYTATAIYHHFADKDALLQELCVADFGTMHTALNSIAGVSDPLERIRLMGMGYVRFALENPELFRFMFLTERPMPSPEELKGKMDPSADTYQHLRAAVQEAIDAGQFKPEITDADQAAQALWALVHGISTLHVMMPAWKQKWLTMRDPHETATLACAAMFNGFLRRPN